VRTTSRENVPVIRGSLRGGSHRIPTGMKTGIIYIRAWEVRLIFFVDLSYFSAINFSFFSLGSFLRVFFLLGEFLSFDGSYSSKA